MFSRGVMTASIVDTDESVMLGATVFGLERVRWALSRMP